ncbi:hypothetical protein AAZX31_U011000 [Glycine max]
MVMTSLQLLWGWRPTPKQEQRHMVLMACFIAIENAQINEGVKLNNLFEEAYERSHTAPTKGAPLQQFNSTCIYNAKIGTKACSSSIIQFNLHLQFLLVT